MQLDVAHRGAPSKSELFQSLQAYLKNKNRLQPIIGLGSITECVKADSQNREAFYLCEVCVCRLSKADMRNHIMGSLHRYNYIKAKHPHFVAEWKENADLSKLAWPLMEMANILERREGPGDVQVLECEEALHDKMVSQNENDAVTMLHTLTRGRGQRESKHRLEHGTGINLPAQMHQGQSGSAPYVKSEPRDAARSQEASSPLENDNYVYEPLIGLSWVVECRGEEDGRSYSFLCHCCRMRSNKEDLIDHLTSFSHLLNYMTETHPEQVEAVMADINEKSGLLLLLAKKVEQREGRGEIKVLNLPVSLCILLTSKSYHWCKYGCIPTHFTLFGSILPSCIMMLSRDNGWTGTNTQKRKMAVEGPTVGVDEASNEDMLQKSAAMLSNPAKGATGKGRKKRKINTVFKVSLPVTKGSMLLERTSFSTDSLPASPTCLTSSKAVDSELDYASGSRDINHADYGPICKTLPLQRGVFRGDADTNVFVGPEGNVTCTLYRGVDGNVNDDQYSNESIYITRPKPRYDSFHQQYKVQGYPSPPAATEGQHGFSGGFSPRGFIDDELIHSSNIGSLEMERRGLQTSGCKGLTFRHAHTARHTRSTHRAVYRAIPVWCGTISDPRSNLEQHLLQLNSCSNGALSHTDMFTPPGPVYGYGIHHSDLNSRGSGDCFGGMMRSRNVDCTPTHMIPCPRTSVDSAHTTASQWDHFPALNTGVPVESNHNQGVQHLF